MYLEIAETSQEKIQIAEWYFEKSYRDSLLSKTNYHQSIIARYIISKNISTLYNVKNYIPPIDYNNSAEEGIHSSISHSNNFIFVGIHTTKIWVDLEYKKKKKTDIYKIFSENEWMILDTIQAYHPTKEKIDFFYILWTSKESLIKFLWVNIDAVEKITLKKITLTESIFSQIKFSYILSLEYNNIVYKTYCGENSKVTYSISF